MKANIMKHIKTIVLGLIFVLSLPVVLIGFILGYISRIALYSFVKGFYYLDFSYSSEINEENYTGEDE